MRSSHSSPTQSTLKHDSSALSRSAFLMARTSYARAKAGGGSCAVALPSTRKEMRAGHRRRGQALLLAVLLMVFAALLGSTFIAVVSLNLNQTGRQENLSSARASAGAGLGWMQTNLVNNAQGDKWRPEMLAPPPAPLLADDITPDPVYNFYYTSFERAQGWARTVLKASIKDTMPSPAYPMTTPQGDWDRSGTFDPIKDDWAKLEYYRLYPDSAIGTSGYSKFPDPRSPQGPATPSGLGSALRPSGNANAPIYLAQVKYLAPSNTPPDSGLSYSSRWGLIQLDVIGLSEDNPSVFDRRIGYLAGTAQSPLASVMRTITNWDFVNKRVPQGYVSADTPAAGLKIPLTFLSSRPLAFPFYISIGGPAGQVPNGVSTNSIKTLLVTGLDGTIPNLYNLARPLTQAILGRERFEIAAALGSPAAIDYNSDGTFNTSTEAAALNVSQPRDSANQPVPGSILVNGGLAFVGNPLMPNLNSGSSRAFIRTSGLISKYDVPAVVPNPATPSNPQVLDAKGNNGTSASFSAALLASVAPAQNPNDFPFVVPISDRDKLVSDGYNAISGNTADPTRQVKPFTPPSIDSNLDRYRQVTKFSAPSPFIPGLSNPTAALYGYGEGTYINNPQDKERKGTAANQYVELNQQELTALWFGSEATGPSFQRRVIPATPSTTTKSLEEQHLRGWVTPEEFQPRGTLIELDPANKQIVVTRDERVDGAANIGTAPLDQQFNEGPVPAQGWYKDDGTLDGNTNTGGVYRKILPWPLNGVIFAEGNVRVRGGAFSTDGSFNGSAAVDPGRSITVVSMNNIYIEGSLNAGPRKVLLLAKKNVVLNPTRVVGRVEAQTRLRQAVNGATTSIPVYDASLFSVGNWIRISNNLRRQVSVVNVVTNTLTISEATPTTANYVVGRVVRAENDPMFDSINANGPYVDYATRIRLFGDVLQRRINLPNGVSQLRVAFRHNGERRDAIGITAKDLVATDTGYDPSNPALTSAVLRNKVVASQQSSVITTAEKTLRIDYNTGIPTAGTHSFPKTARSPESSTTSPYGAKQYTLAPATPALPAPDNDTQTDLQTDLGKPRMGANWRYDATIQNNYNTPAPVPPAFFLAALGNRPDIYPSDFVPATEKAITFPYGLNLRPAAATSLEKKLPMATSIVLQTNGAQALLVNDFMRQVVRQFGFSFLHGADLLADADTTNDNDAQEDVLTVDQSFYRNGQEAVSPTAKPRNDRLYDDTYFLLDSRTLNGSYSAGVNNVSLQLNPQVETYFTAGNTLTPPVPSIPSYRLSRMKLEKIVTTSATDNTPEFVQPAVTIDIRAFAYAQEGSWAVIPGTLFDDKVKSDPATGDAFVDYNNNGKEPSEATTTGAITGPDLNRDGTVTRAEQVAAYRFRRYNYQINFTGAIMERQSTTVVDEGIGAGAAKGAVQDAMDKWATVYLSTANFAGNTPADSLSKASVASTQTTPLAPPGALRGMNYTFDPSVTDPTFAINDPGFVMPVSPDLIYSG